MANSLEGYSAYLFNTASELQVDAKNSLEKLRNSNISKTKLSSIEEQVNKLVLFKKPLQPKSTEKFNEQCTTIYQPYFDSTKNLFSNLLRSNLNDKELSDMWSKDFRVAGALAKVNFDYCQKNPPQIEKKPDKKAPKPGQTSNLSLIDYMTEKGLVGLPKNLDEVLRPIIARGHLKEVRDRRNINVDKGIILYGPPGTGKTSFVRNLADYLGCDKENVQLVSAPELVSCLVGNTEGNIRSRFKPSIDAWEKFGEESPLFIVAIDEFENLALSRETSENDWSKRSVVQLLTSLDGFLQQKNLLVIGLTNHITMIDSALLRNGRFGTTIKIDLPDANGRKAILNLYLKDLTEFLDEKFTIEELVEKTEDFSGADLKGAVEDANRIAYNRYSVAYSAKNSDQDNVDALGKITVEDFKRAIEKIKGHKKTKVTPPTSVTTTSTATQTVNVESVTKKAKPFNTTHWAKQNVDYSTLEEVDFEPKDSFGVRLYAYLKANYCIIERGKLKTVGFFRFVYEKICVLLGYRDRTIRVAAKIEELKNHR